MTLLRFGHPLLELRALMQREAPPADLAEAAAALATVRRESGWDVLDLLIPLLRHPDAGVRVGACRGLGGHPFHKAWLALYDVSVEDTSQEVRKAAEAAMGAHEVAPMQCLVCGLRATLKPDPDSDPHGEHLVYPVFCSEKCAVRFALRTARDGFHRCAPDGVWHVGREEECGTCRDYQGVGPDLPAAEKPKRRRASKR